MRERASKIHHCVVKTSRGEHDVNFYTVCWQKQSDCLLTFTGISGWAAERDGDGLMENVELFFKLEISKLMSTRKLCAH